MGLSDGERQIKLYWAVHHLAVEGRNLPTKGWDHEGYDRLRSLCDQVWFAFLGSASNGAHWFLGSSATNEIGKPNSPWSLALMDHFETDRARTGPKDWLEEATEAAKKAYDEAEDPDLVDNPDDKHQRNSIDISSLLGHVEQPGLKATYLIYAYTENVTYALRRYDDDFRAGYPTLDKLITDIQGACFEIFTKHEEFAAAYLLNQILEKLYGYENPVKCFAMKQHWHHHLYKPMRGPLADIRRWHLTIVDKGDKMTPTDWVVMALEMMGGSYEYEHQLKEMYRIAKKRDIELDKERIDATFDKCVKLHKAESKGHTDEYRNDREYEHINAVHGRDAAGRLRPWKRRAKPRKRPAKVAKVVEPVVAPATVETAPPPEMTPPVALEPPLTAKKIRNFINTPKVPK